MAPQLGEIIAEYLVIDSSTGNSHGTYETLTEARGCIAFDRLSFWVIWRAGQIVDKTPYKAAPVYGRHTRPQLSDIQ